MKLNKLGKETEDTKKKVKYSLKINKLSGKIRKSYNRSVGIK